MLNNTVLSKNSPEPTDSATSYRHQILKQLLENEDGMHNVLH